MITEGGRQPRETVCRSTRETRQQIAPMDETTGSKNMLSMASCGWTTVHNRPSLNLRSDLSRSKRCEMSAFIPNPPHVTGRIISADELPALSTPKPIVAHWLAFKAALRHACALLRPFPALMRNVLNLKVSRQSLSKGVFCRLPHWSLVPGI